MLARFEPIREWRVIGPFPRATPQVFIGDPAIDFAQAHVGALGRSIVWSTRQADPATGRVDLSDLKNGAGDRGGFGYDAGGSPDLGAFAYTEVEADRAGPAILLIGSSGTLIVTVNEQPVYQYTNSAGRGYALGSDVARFDLARGRNRILVVCRQGIGPWRFGLQIARVTPRAAREHLSPRRSSCGASTRWPTKAIPARERRFSLTPEVLAAPGATRRPAEAPPTSAPT